MDAGRKCRVQLGVTSRLIREGLDWAEPSSKADKSERAVSSMRALRYVVEEVEAMIKEADVCVRGIGQILEIVG